MSDRAPVVPKLKACCHGGCLKEAVWRIIGNQGDTAETCTEHVGAMLSPGINTVSPLSLELSK